MGICYYNLNEPPSSTYEDPNVFNIADTDVLNIAVVILLTKDPGVSGGFLDSITALSVSLDEINSRHSISKVALIHEDVTRCLPVLWQIGIAQVGGLDDESIRLRRGHGCRHALSPE